jgi:hypothetical protein
MLNAQFRPLEQWPGERTRGRQRARFRSVYSKTLDTLESELAKLRAKNITIQVDGLSLQFIRNDGWPRAEFFNLKHANCGVILSFESSKGPMSMPCDKFNDWKDNLRAIALSLEALRQVDRYGVTRGNEQYKGWTRLPEAVHGQMSRERAAQYLGEVMSVDPIRLLRETSESITYICRSAMAKYHPDHGKDEADRKRRHEIFVKVGQVQEVLCR